MHSEDFQSILLTLKVAAVSVILLLLIATPLAVWLAQKKSLPRRLVSSIVLLPLVLPPTVLGFYLLLLLGPSGLIGSFMMSIGSEPLTFTFSGVVIASMIFSFPFVVLPILSAIEAQGKRPSEIARSFGATSWSVFWNVTFPQAKSGFFIAAILGFTHTLGEFGVVLMVGGSIPDVSRVVSIQIYSHVESLEFYRAHWLAGVMVLFSFITLLLVYRQKDGQPFLALERFRARK